MEFADLVRDRRSVPASADPGRVIAAHDAYKGDHRERQRVVAAQLFAANDLDTPRRPVSEVATYVGFPA